MKKRGRPPETERLREPGGSTDAELAAAIEGGIKNPRAYRGPALSPEEAEVLATAALIEALPSEIGRLKRDEGLAEEVIREMQDASRELLAQGRAVEAGLAEVVAGTKTRGQVLSEKPLDLPSSERTLRKGRARMRVRRRAP